MPSDYADGEGGNVTEEDLEYVASAACAESGLGDRPRCDPRTMAVSYCGLTLAPWPRVRPHIARRVLWYPSDVTEDAQAYFVAHEVGHELLDGAGLVGDDLERGASRVGSGILLPRRPYLRDLAATSWDLREMRRLWPLASAWVHARRMAEVCEGIIASRWRGGRLVARSRPGRPMRLERELAAEVAAAGADVDRRPQGRAWRCETDAIVIAPSGL